MARNAQLGLAWYTREGWMRIHKLADDRDPLDDTFEGWERGATAAIRELEAAGRQVRKVPVDIEALACREHRRALDSAARTQFVSDLMKGAARV